MIKFGIFHDYNKILYFKFENYILLRKGYKKSIKGEKNGMGKRN